MTLKSKTLKGVKWTTISMVNTVILGLIQLAILARILSPVDFGLMAIVMVVIGFSQSFLDAGISMAIIYKQNITRDQLSTIYWLNIITGFLLFAIICAIAPLISLFYHEDRLTNLIISVSIIFIIQPFGQQFMILLQKDLKFREIAKIEIINKVIFIIVTTGFAYYGYGVYALIFGTISEVAVQTLLYILLGLKEYKPKLIFKWNEITEFINFGLYQIGERTINYFNSQIDVIIIGKLLGTGILGIYSIAKQLVTRPAEMINPIITKVTFPVMSRVQDDIVRLKNIYLTSINNLSSVNFALYAFILIFAHDIVIVLFGDKWIGAITIIQILCIWGAMRSTINPIGSLLLAKGKANWGFWWNFVGFFIIPVVIYAGSYWGLIGVSWALVFITCPVLMLGNWYFLVRKLCGAGFAEYHLEIIKPFFITVIAGATCYFVIQYIEYGIIRFAVGLSIGLAVVIGMNWFLNKSFLLNIVDLFSKGK